MKSYKQKVIHAFLWMGAGTLVGQLVAWISTIFVIRLLTPSDYGVMAMVLTFAYFMQMISEFGIGAAIIQKDKVDNNQIRQVHGFVLIFCLLGSILTYFSAPLVAAFFNEDGLVNLVKFISLNFILVAFYTVPQSLLVREMNFKSKAKVDFSSQVITALTTLILAFLDFGVWALAIGVVISHVVKVIGFTLSYGSWIWPDFRFTQIKSFFNYGMILTFERMLWYVYIQADIVIGGKMLGGAALGFYNVALTLSSLVLDKILPTVTQIVFASYSRIQSDIERINRNLLTSIKLISAILFPISYGMAAVAPEALPLLLGNKWIPIIVPFQILCFIAPFKGLGALFPPALFAIDKPKVNLANMAIAALIMTLAFYIGAHWGIIGLSVAWLAGYPFVFFIIMRRCLHNLNMGMKIVLLELLFPIASSILMFIVIYLFRNSFPEYSQLVLFISSTLLGVMLYFALVLLFKKDSYMELVSFIRKKS